MGDSVDGWRALSAHIKSLRRAYGVPCPECIERRPRGDPSLLLPAQRCRVDGYVDPRPELTNEQHEQAVGK